MKRVTVPSLLALALLACDPADPGNACDTSGDCDDGAACVDGRCAARADGGGSDAGAIDAGRAADAGRVDAGPVDAGSEVCRAVESAARVVTVPADILIVVDSSSSMGDARARIAEVINASFDAILNAAGIDYRVILFADPTLVSVDGALAAYDPARLFVINLPTGSGPGANFSVLLNRYDTALSGPPPTAEVAWSTLLRPDAVKIFMHFTDATSGDGASFDGYSGTFDQELYALDAAQFGASAADKKLIYHSFVGHQANTPDTEPFGPSDPIASGSCNGSFSAGAGYQAVAVATGGLRFPVCNYDGYPAVFERIADDVIDVVEVECTFPLPEPPVGETLDLTTVAVRYTRGDGSDEILLQTDAASCDDGRFTIDEAAGTLSLCPAACTRIQADSAARVDVAFGCDPTLL